MNGRIYDPILGRFLSPDNYIQLPDFTQSFNRYAYAFNNPLKFTDPSGEIVWLAPVIIGAAMGAIQGYQIGQALGASGWGMVGYIAGGAAIGGLSGFASWGLGSLGMSPWGVAGITGIINNAGYSALQGGTAGQIIGSGITGGIAGLSGGLVGGAIGGVPGNFFGSIANYSAEWAMNNIGNYFNGRPSEKYNLAQAVTTAGISTASYLGSSYYE